MCDLDDDGDTDAWDYIIGDALCDALSGLHWRSLVLVALAIGGVYGVGWILGYW